MKPLLLVLILVSMTISTMAQTKIRQQTGELFYILPYKIEVSHLATTILVFPFEVKEADMGVGELLASKIPDVKNVLKLKAETPSLDTTSLYVCTSDGKVHVFEVTYTSRTNPIAYELKEDGSLSLPAMTNISFASQPLNDKLLTDWVAKVKQSQTQLNKTKRNLGIAVTLKGTYAKDNYIFLKFIIQNTSSLPYSPGWTQITVKDKKQRKRTALQEIPVIPVFADSLSELGEKSEIVHIVAIARQTIPNSKKMIFELHETNGGRNILFRIKNKQLLLAQPLQ
jgi:conjugative transposon TraN protein